MTNRSPYARPRTHLTRLARAGAGSGMTSLFGASARLNGAVSFVFALCLSGAALAQQPPSVGGPERSHAQAAQQAAQNDFIPRTQAADAQAVQQMQQELEPKAHGLTSADVVKLALDYSPSVRKAGLDADKAAANRARAKLAFAPRMDLLAKYTRVSHVNMPAIELTPGMPFKFPQVLNQYVTQATLMVPITDLFLTIIPTYKAANLNADVAEQQRRAQCLQVSYDARVAFYDYAHVLSQIAVARASVKVNESGVRDLEALVAAGTATQTELTRAKAELANAQTFLVQAEGNVVVAQERLAQLTGVQVDPARGIGEPFVNIEIGEPPSVQEVMRVARESRPELLALRKLKLTREKLLNARRGAEYPQLRGFGNVYYSKPNPRIQPQLNEWRGSWDLGVQLAWSPNDAVYAHTQANDAESDLRVVEEDLRATEQGIAVEAATAVTTHRTASAGITSKTEALNAAQRYHADQRALLLAGAATPNDVLLAERDLVQASLDWVDSFIQARIAQAALLKAQGKTGLTQD